MASGSLNILLVEDNPDHAELIRRGFAERSKRVELTVVQDGEQALDFLLRRGAFGVDPRPWPDLVLLDLRLPKLDGFQVLRQIKASQQLRRIPTVILTTSDAESDLVKAYAEHANSYLVKPADFERFVTLAANVEEYWFECNRQPRFSEPGGPA